MSGHIARRTYFVVFFALMALLVLTVGAALLPYGRWNLRALGISITLTIATVKAALVVIYFMHVRVSSRLTRLFACMGLVWLLILFGLTLNDYLTRSWLPASRGWTDRVREEVAR